MPLAFVAMEARCTGAGLARNGPTYREAVLVHAVARIVLGDVIPNIQASWVKMAPKVPSSVCRLARTISAAADEQHHARCRGEHGQRLHIIEALAQDLGRVARHRNTLYGDVGDERPSGGVSVSAAGVDRQYAAATRQPALTPGRRVPEDDVASRPPAAVGARYCNDRW